MKLKPMIFFKDIKGDVEEKLDTSNFRKDHPSGIPLKSKKVLGMMKDEASGKIIEEFVGLRAKRVVVKKNECVKKS